MAPIMLTEQLSVPEEPEPSTGREEATMKRFASVGVLILLSLGVAARAAYAIPITFPEMKVSDSQGDSITINGAGTIVASSGTVKGFDFSGSPSINTGPGLISLAASLGTSGTNGWKFTVDTGISSGTATAPTMDLSFDAQSVKGGTLTVQFSDGNFGPVTSTVLTAAVNGNGPNGTTQYQVLFDPSNGAFSGSPPIFDSGKLPSPINVAGPTSSITAGNPFSLTQVITIVQTATGVTSGDASLTTVVPEPAPLLLLGSGLVGFGYLRRRNRGKGRVGSR